MEKGRIKRTNINPQRSLRSIGAPSIQAQKMRVETNQRPLMETGTLLLILEPPEMRIWANQRNSIFLMRIALIAFLVCSSQEWMRLQPKGAKIGPIMEVVVMIPQGNSSSCQMILPKERVERILICHQDYTEVMNNVLTM